MNILYCGDKGIARGVLVSVLSLLMNGRKKYDAKTGVTTEVAGAEPIYNIYIMTAKYGKMQPFEKKTAEFLDKLVKNGVKVGDTRVGGNPKSFVKLVDATEVFVKNLPEKNMGTYFTPGAMLRLYMDKVPELRKLDRVLYLDYDVVCRGDIREFYEMDLDEVEAAGALDIYGRRWYKYHGLFKKKNDAREWVDVKDRPRSVLKQDYMNSGVMLFNMRECEKTEMFAKARKLCAEKRMLLPDQGALNRAILKRRLVARRYNEQEERPRPDTALHHFSNNFKFWPYFRVQKVKPFEVEKVHEILKIHEYDDIIEVYKELEVEL